MTDPPDRKHNQHTRLKGSSLPPAPQFLIEFPGSKTFVILSDLKLIADGPPPGSWTPKPGRAVGPARAQSLLRGPQWPGFSPARSLLGTEGYPRASVGTYLLPFLPPSPGTCELKVPEGQLEFRLFEERASVSCRFLPHRERW